MIKASKKIEKYFAEIEKHTSIALKLAESARSKGFDPEKKVDIPIAKNMAERVLGLISAVAPKLSETNIVERIMELEKEYSPLDWRVGFKIAAEVALEKFCKFPSKKEAVEIGIRTGFTYLTGGIVSAPLEGFVGIKIKKRNDGKEYVSTIYAGPIRGAGGTAAATSVVLSDYVAAQAGYSKYDPSDDEIKRAISELYDYHERVTNLQYLPSPEEIEFMVKHLPVEVDGEPTERIEVSNHKDLPRIETNFIRGGICLVIGEGLCQKAPKIWKRLSKWGKDFGLDWAFLDEFLKIKKKVQAKTAKKESAKKLSPNYTFINDMVAGRPVLTYPMAYGGFRLRMGRTRTSGFSAIAINPYTMKVLDDFIVYGTQLKIERPGKAGSVTLCEAIEGPIVLLNNGDVVEINKNTKEHIKDIKKILFLGDMLINYGDFSENGHSLIPIGYCEEWWLLELKRKIQSNFNSLDVSKTSELTGIAPERLNLILKDAFNSNVTFSEAYVFSKKLSLSMHPDYIYYYTALSLDDLSTFFSLLKKVKVLLKDDTTKSIKSLVFEKDESFKKILEKIGVSHELASNEFIVINNKFAESFACNFGINSNFDIKNNKLQDNLITLYDDLIKECNKKKEELNSPANSDFNLNFNKDEFILGLINKVSEVHIKDKAGSFIGARMGRPEKAKMRKLQGSPQVLFPVGEEGGRLKSFQSSIQKGEVTSEFPIYYCEKCKKRTIYHNCHICYGKAKKIFFCPTINKEIFSDEIPVKVDEQAKSYRNITINIGEYIDSCLKQLKTKVYPDLIKGVKGTSNKDHIPEHLIKGFIRAKNDIYVNKDGTTRYDMSEAPITAFKPKEIGTSIEKLKNLGYVTDIDGNELEKEDQVVELLPQDVILPAGASAIEEQADDIILRIGSFVDELLQKLYGMNKYYKFRSKEDIPGSLIICLAPHTSCGTIGRIIGFSKNQVMLAHPMMHAAMRRDCDGDEACFIMLMDAFLNFSRQYLPDKRGTRTMDAPLVLSTIIIPAEVDDQVHGLDVVKEYPLELYEAAKDMKMPWEVKVEQLNDRLNTEEQYQGFYYTHPVININSGPKVSSYKVLPSMQEKLDGQMKIANKIAAVDTSNVAAMVIQKHFLRDIKGNLRKFSLQQFRCVQCNLKYVRPPLIGKCPVCSGKLLFTISEGSIIKYLGASVELANKYDVPTYLKQTIEILKEHVDSVFGKEKEVQEGLGKFF